MKANQNAEIETAKENILFWENELKRTKLIAKNKNFEKEYKSLIQKEKERLKKYEKTT